MLKNCNFILFSPFVAVDYKDRHIIAAWWQQYIVGKKEEPMNLHFHGIQRDYQGQSVTKSLDPIWSEVCKL